MLAALIMAFAVGEQQAAVAAPPAALGCDYNNNGICDAADYTVWRDLLATNGRLQNESVTLGVVNQADYDAWKHGFGETIGGGGASAGLACDFNLDGACDAADYTIWRNNRGAMTDASLNGGGDQIPGVNQGDYHVWKTGFGGDIPGSGSFAPAISGRATPEPASWIFAALGVSLPSWRRPRRTTTFPTAA